jgi:hypothetical protein
MGNLLEQEADRLKGKYGLRYHELIDRNLTFISGEMSAVPGSVDVNEELLALSRGLPPLNALPKRAPKSNGRKSTSKIVSGKAHPTRFSKDKKKIKRRSARRTSEVFIRSKKPC